MVGNREVIAINQDALGQPARRVWAEGFLEGWARPLANGDHAVGLFNRGPFEAAIRFPFGTVVPGRECAVRDVWTRRELGRQGVYTGELPPHGSRLLRLSPR